MSDKFARFLTGPTVLMVAAFAAVVSYSHIYDLARLHGESGVAARLLPLSVDGLILAASLVLLHEARAHRPAPGLAQFGLALGVLATVTYGAAYGVVGALISAWPAVAFVLSTEIMVGQVRRASTVPTAPGDTVETVAAPVPADVPGIGPVAVPVGTVSPKGATVPGTVAVSRARSRARGRAPERVFSAELERGELPSLRAVKSRLHVGTDRARVVREQLQTAMAGQEVTADV